MTYYVNHSALPLLTGDHPARIIHAVRPDGLETLCAGLPSSQAAYLAGVTFSGRARELVLLPGEEGVSAAVLGLGNERSHLAFGELPYRLPEGAWALAPGDFEINDAILGFCLGAYRFGLFKKQRRPCALLVIGSGNGAVIATAASIWMGRDLVNAPANILGPNELATAAGDMALPFGAQYTRFDALDQDYPTVAAVGRGSDRPPVVVRLTWRGSTAAANAPHVSLCGKGVVFDSGGYDMKPSAGMLRMKKDMGGAASVLTLARIIMEADLPIRLSVRLGCVENSVSGHAMRPLDIIRTRRGLSVEIGNTDAEGRLVLCDLLAEASDEKPDLLLNCATLTGAARVALGPDLPALFCTDPGWARDLLAAGREVCDPMWELPLWDGYDGWLDSPAADLNNVSSKSHAGAITAALFMRRFIAPGVPWAHIDTYAWNDNSRPARPEGGEILAMRGVARAIAQRFAPDHQI